MVELKNGPPLKHQEGLQEPKMEGFPEAEDFSAIFLEGK